MYPQKANIPFIFHELEANRQFKRQTPNWTSLSSEELKNRWMKFKSEYNKLNGIISLGTVMANGKFVPNVV
jgi:hypothetical protein